MAISLKPEHLKRYKDVAKLLLKYGRLDLVRHAGLDSVLADEPPGSEPPIPPEAAALANDLEQMGPTFIKLGQLLSTRADILPQPYIDALSRLQDSVAPFSFQEVEEIVTRELGVRLSKGFAEFDPQPIAAASLGQVHRARLRDGRPVAVKIQRPGIRERAAEDIEALSHIAQFLDSHTEAGHHYRFTELLDQFRKSLTRELDYRQEAKNMALLSANLAEFDAIIVPLAVPNYTTARVLTMDYIRGRKVTALSPLARIEIDGRYLGEQLFRAYLKQILVDGFFHADPHPGNIFLADDGQIALLDVGMVAWVRPAMQDRLLQLLIAVSEGDSDEAASFAIQIGEKTDEFNETPFRQAVAEIVSQHQGAILEQIAVGRVVLTLTKISSDNGLRLPTELAMLGKTLLNLDRVGTTLDPTLDPQAVIRRHVAEIMSQRVQRSLSFGSIFTTLLDLKEFVRAVPQRVNRILDLAANNELGFKVHAIDERQLMEGLQKIANRITMGLVLAALIVGAAMLTNVPTTFRIWGYPGLATILFIAAATGGVILVLNIVINDVKAKRKR